MLKKKSVEGKCQASHCRSKATEIHNLEDPVYLCAKHGTEARQEYDTDVVIESLNTMIHIDTQDRPQQQAATELEDALLMIQDFEIQSQEDFTFCESILADSKTQWKEYEQKRKKATKPINEGLREINSWYKPVLSTLEEIKKICESKLKQYRCIQQQERERLIEVAKVTEEPVLIKETLIQASTTLPQETSTFIDRWIFEIVDAEKIPREFLCPDEVKIGKLVQMLKDKTSIPGVRVWNDPIVRS